MTRRSKEAFSPDSVVIYCSSVWGGYSWALTDSSDKAGVREICIRIEEEIGATLACCTLQGLISGKSGNRDINDHWRAFVKSIENDEYEQFENLGPEALDTEALLDPKNYDLLRDLMQVFFWISP